MSFDNRSRVTNLMVYRCLGEGLLPSLRAFEAAQMQGWGVVSNHRRLMKLNDVENSPLNGGVPVVPALPRQYVLTYSHLLRPSHAFGPCSVGWLSTVSALVVG
jgi:hypothetical protein